MNATCNEDAEFVLFSYEDHFEAAHLIQTNQLSDTEAEKLLWEKSIRQQTKGILHEYAHIPICTKHLGLILQTLVGLHAVLAYTMPALHFGIKQMNDAAIFRFKKEADAYNILLLPGNCRNVEQLRQVIIAETLENSK